jgi:hypothetical protein
MSKTSKNIFYVLLYLAMTIGFLIFGVLPSLVVPTFEVFYIGIAVSLLVDFYVIYTIQKNRRKQQ